MKKSLVLFFIVLLTMFTTSIVAFATPQLKIRNSDLKCDESFSGNGYTGCTLSVDLRIEDYEYSDKYSNLTYKVECEATFNYLTPSSYGSWSNSNYVYDYVKIWGTNRTKTLDLRTTFSTIDPVYKASVSNLRCKVKDIY